MNASEPHWWEIHLGLSEGLVLSDKKSLAEQMLTKIRVVILHHQAAKS